MGKKKAPMPAPPATVNEDVPTATFTLAEAKKVAKLLKAADRGKRLDAIRTVSENHEYIATGGCLLPLLESTVTKKKMEHVVKAAGQVIAEYLIGRDGEDVAVPSNNTLKAMEEAKKKPQKYKMAEMMGNLVLNPDQGNSWNAVRSLRSMAAIVASLSKDSPQGVSLGTLLLGSGKVPECLCRFFLKQEHSRQVKEAEVAAVSADDNKNGDISWPTVRIHVLDTLGVMCAISDAAIETVVTSGSVPFLLGILRSITASEAPDMSLLTSTLVIVSAVAKRGSVSVAGNQTGGAPAASVLPVAAVVVEKQLPELAALAEGGAWGAVYDALKGPIMACAVELQSGVGKGGKKLESAVSVDLAECLNNMARCAEVLRVMAMTGAGVQEEGALETGVAAMGSILGMQGLPREEIAVANLMTGMVKAMGSIACLSEGNRVKVCSAGVAPMVLALMAPPNLPAAASTAATTNSPTPPDTSHGRLMRKTAEKCLHHLLVSRVTWMADDRALCDTSCLENGQSDKAVTADRGGEKTSKGDKRRDSSSRDEQRSVEGPAYLTVESVLAAINADSIEVRCRAIRLLSRLVSSHRNAMTLGTAAVPALSRLVAWWLRTKDDPEADRTPREVDANPPQKGKRLPEKVGGGKKGETPPPASKEEVTVAEEALNSARVAAKRLEDSDGTRVLRDEALAYTLGVLMKLSTIGPDERAAIGADILVDLLAKVLKAMPCTLEEFFPNSVSSKPPPTDEGNLDGAPKSIAAQYHSSTDETHTRKLPLATDPPDKPDTSLDLTATDRVQHNTPRHRFCWRGSESRDPEVAFFSPLDWDWDFKVSPSQEPTQPGLVLRSATLRVLATVVEGFDPYAGSTVQSTTLPTDTGKNAAAAAAAAASSTASGADGANKVLKHTLTVCLDLLSVDVVHHKIDLKTFSGGCDKRSGISFSRGEAVDSGSAPGTANVLLGMPVSPLEELVHGDIRLGCLRLLASLLRLGRIARERLISTADTHRGGWRKLASRHFLEIETAETCDAATGEGGIGGEKGESIAEPWKNPDTFRCWDFCAEIKWGALQTSLPYVRTISMLLVPLRNPDAPITHVMAALVALRRLCREGEHEVGGAKPEPSPEGEPPLPTSRESTSGALEDTISGVAVGIGALVPLISIWGCAAAATGEGMLPAETIGMVDECQGLIDYLIRRGHSREEYWSSLPSLKNPDDEATGAAAAAKNKATGKAAKSSAKKGKTSSKDVPGPAAKAHSEANQEPMPPPPLGRPDPNLGPDRTTWSALLNAHLSDERTQTSTTTALLMATITGLETAVRNLLVAGADPNVRDSNGRTPLMCALAQGMVDVVPGLVEAGGDVDAVDVHGSNVLKSAFLCPPRRTMRNIIRRRSGVGTAVAAASEAAAFASGAELPSIASTRQGSTSHTDRSMDSTGRPRSRSRSGSVSVGRTRNRSGSLATGRRRSSLGQGVLFSEADGGAACTPASVNERRRLSRTSSMSALDSARAALRAAGRTEPAGPLKTPRGTIVVQGEPRMVHYILSCGADPNVSGGAGDFPLHWAVTGTELTVPIMNQLVRIVAGSGARPDASGEVNINNQRIGGANDRRGSVDLSTSDRGGGERMNDEALLNTLFHAGSSVDLCNPAGMTALHVAVIVDRADLARVLLDAGASPNVSDSLGCLPLHYACLRATAGYEKLADRLLALGMGRPVNKGVFRDLRKGRTRRERLLLDVGDIMRDGLREATEPSSITQHRATFPELLNHVSAEGFAPLHYVCDGRIGPGREAVAAVLTRSQKGVPISSHISSKAHLRPSSSGAEDADSSSSPERPKLLQRLLSEPELDPRVRVPHGATTLHLAAQSDQGSQGAELTRMLLHTGVNIDALDTPPACAAALFSGVSGSPHGAPHCCAFPAPGEQGCGASTACGTHLEWAGKSRDFSEDDSSTAEMPLNLSALHYALRKGSWETAGVLLSSGANVRPEGAFPPCLHVACQAGAPASLVLRLLEPGEVETESTTVKQSWAELGAASYAKTCPYATTPLFLATACGSAELVALLLPKYNDAVKQIIQHNNRDVRDDDSSQDVWSIKHSPADERNPLHAAAVGGHKEVMRTLLDAGAGKAWLNAKDVTGRTPLDLAVDWGKWEIAAFTASVNEFDVRLAIDGGKACALLSAERANMAIVDAGSGEMSALSALHESNNLIMTLLQRLRKVEREAAAVTMSDEQRLKDYGERPAVLYNALEDDGIERQADGGGLGVVEHVHPCFAEGVLYSNAKGVYIPDTNEKSEADKDQSEEGFGGEK